MSAATPFPPLAPTPPHALWFTRFHVWLYRASGGRLGGQFRARRFLMLTTTGRKTGRRYTNPLEFHSDGQTPYLIASHFGRDRPPAWYLNLLAHPTVEIERDGGHQWATARVASSEDRQRLWPELVRVAPYYARYQRGIAREIPLVLLYPAE